MNIEWITQEKTSNAVTIYNNNITFNKQATNYLVDAYGIAVGFDRQDKKIIIKKVSKEEVDNKIFKKEDIYMLTIKLSFGRINNKKLIEKLTNYLEFDFSKHTSYKYSATYNTGNKMLIVDTKEESLND